MAGRWGGIRSGLAFRVEVPFNSAGDTESARTVAVKDWLGLACTMVLEAPFGFRLRCGLCRNLRALQSWHFGRCALLKWTETRKENKFCFIIWSRAMKL